MLITWITIALRNSNNPTKIWIRDASNIFSDQQNQCNAEVIQAIRFVLDANDPESNQTLDQRQFNYVRLHVTYDAVEVLPILLINTGSRAFTVTRYAHGTDPDIAIHLDGSADEDCTTADPDCTLSASEFRSLLNGNLRSRCDAEDSALAQDGALQVQRLVVDSNWLESCVASSLADFEMRESESTKSQALQVLQSEPQAVGWRREIEECEDELDATTLAECKLRLKTTRHLAFGLHCRLNQHLANGELRQDAVRPQIDAFSGCIELARESLDSAQHFPETRSNRVLLELHEKLKRSERAVLMVQQMQSEAEAPLGDLHAVLMVAHGGRLPLDETRRRTNREKLRELTEKLARTETILQSFRDRFIAAQRELKKLQNAATAERRAVEARFTSQIDEYLYHLNVVHKQQLESMDATVDLYDPHMRTIFQIDVLTGVDALDTLLRADAQLSQNFLGYLIDFVVFREEHKEIAAKVQFALREVLLVGIFASDASREQCSEKLHGGFAKLFALDSYRSNDELSAAMQAPTIDIRPLAEYLQPIDEDEPCRTIVMDVLDEYMVMNSAAYELDEAAAIYKRHMICAQTGRCARYDSAYIECAVVQTNAAARTVFDVWKRIGNRHEWYADRSTQSRMTNVKLSGVNRSLEDLLVVGLQVDKIRANERSVELRMNDLQAGAFKAQRNVHRLKQSIREVSGTIELDDQLMSADRCAPLRTTLSANVGEFRRLQNAVILLQAKHEKLCADIGQLYDMIRGEILLVGPKPPAERNAMLHDICRRIAEQRERITNDWQRHAETATGLQSMLTANRRAKCDLRRALELHDKARELTERLLHHRREKERFDEKPELLERFAHWSADEISSELRELEKIVFPRSEIAKCRRLYDKFAEHHDQDKRLLNITAQMLQLLEQNNRLRSDERVHRIANGLRAIVPLFQHTSGDAAAPFIAQVLLIAPATARGVPTHPQLEMALTDGGGSLGLVHLGRNEMRFGGFVLYLADCIADGSWRDAILLIDNTNLDLTHVSRMQVMEILRNSALFKDMQLFCTFSEKDLRRFGV